MKCLYLYKMCHTHPFVLFELLYLPEIGCSSFVFLDIYIEVVYYINRKIALTQNIFATLFHILDVF